LSQTSLTIDDVLAPEGLIASHLPNYEHRPEQLDMARAVASALTENQHILAEAGTGVGKSFAYLIPAILQAVTGQDKRRVVISTYTIALQEQLINKDLPFLAKVLPVEFSAELGKGRRNYLCFRRMALAVKGRDKIFGSEAQQVQLDELADWAMDTAGGELQEIDFELDSFVWSRVCSEPGTCRGGKCEYRSRCHLTAARRRLLGADIAVVNHSMFFADLAMKGSEAKLLGDYDYAVLDEAHTVESVASDHFGRSVSSSHIARILRDLFDENTGRGLLAMIGTSDAIESVQRAAGASGDFFDALRSLGPPAVANNGRIRQANILPDTISPALRSVAGQLRQLRSKIENEDQKFELAGIEIRLIEAADTLAGLIAQGEEEHVYWFSTFTPSRPGRRPGRRGPSQPIVTLSSSPINVAPILREALFDSVSSVVLTSATLATARGQEHGFEYIRKRLGLADGHEILLASPFNYRKQAKLYIESQLGNPNILRDFAPAAGGAICHYIDKSQGRCFVLATSYAMLDALGDSIGPWCDEHDYELLIQGRKLQRTAMLERFGSQERCVLMGTMSFWQGVDVAGEALRNVIITKLPFAVPDAPITEARIEAIRKTGGNPFGEFQLPQAVILFKQGFGRLIRSTNDTGFVVVLDHRIATKSYGQSFIKALPDVEVVRDEFTQQQKK